MLVVSLLAILTSLAVPGFQQAIASTRLSTATNELYTSLLQARSEATRRGTRMTVCKSNNGTSCLSGSGSWSTGWIGFADPTRAGSTPSIDSGETVSFVVQPMPAAISISGNTNVVDYVSYSADGRSKTLTGSFTTGIIRVCSTSSALSNDTRARDLNINIAGRITITKATGVTSACPAL